MRCTPASPMWWARSCARWCPTRPMAGPSSTAACCGPGVPIRFERELVATGRHLELAAFRIEPASRRQVAVLFQDITARKRAEAAMQHLNETLEVARRRGDRRAQARRRGAAPVAEDGGGRPAHRRHRARLQQSADRHHRHAGAAADPAAPGPYCRDSTATSTPRQGASKRAAALTHRLLAFSRRQTLDPKPTDVNRLVGGMEELSAAPSGRQITLEVVDGRRACGRRWSTRSQLENALLNLCINARDAMPDGGRITIETANKWLDDRAARERDLPPGQYVSLCVTDTGTGMTPDVIARAFDPFFTTKPLGQGTGLGLSMIYGFVRQSGGQVRIYSEVGKGTTMCLYLPRHYGDGARPTRATAPAAAARERPARRCWSSRTSRPCACWSTEVLRGTRLRRARGGRRAGGAEDAAVGRAHRSADHRCRPARRHERPPARRRRARARGRTSRCCSSPAMPRTPSSATAISRRAWRC